MQPNGKIQLYPLLRIVLFFILGIISADCIGSAFKPSLWLSFLIASLVLSLTSYRKGIVQTVFIMLTAFILGGYITCDKEAQLDSNIYDAYQDYEGVVVSEPVIKEKTVLCDMIITKSQHLSNPIKVKSCFLKDDYSSRLSIGDGISAYSRLEKPKNYKRSTFDYKRYLMYHEYSAQTFIYYKDWKQKSISLTNLSILERTELAAIRFRQRLLSKYKAHNFNGQVYAIIAAMTLGDKSTLSKQTKDIYSVTGASHVLALSGLHLGIIYSILTILTFKKQKKILGQIIILISIWSFTILVGMAPSVARSATMLSICSVNEILGRSKFSLNTLALTALIMLLCNPLNLFDVGFELSFMAVLSILVFYRPIYKCVDKNFISNHYFLNLIWQISAVSIAAQICTAPLVCYYFGRISCYFILTNLIVILAANIILCFGIGLLTLSFIPVLNNLIAFVLSYTVKSLNSTLSFIANMPGSSIDGLQPSCIQIIMVYIIIISTYILIRYVIKLHRISLYLDKNS